MLELNLDNEALYIRFHHFELDWASTWGATGEYGNQRERIRKAVAKKFPTAIPKVDWWAFRIQVKKAPGRRFDIDNVIKPLIDAFSETEIENDTSVYPNLKLYEDDTIDNVKIIEVSGERVGAGEQESTIVEIFGRRKCSQAVSGE